MRKPPTTRNFKEDELPKFLREVDPFIKSVFELEKHAPEGFTCRRTDDCLLFYRLECDEKTHFPKLLESIKVDKDLHVQLQYNGEPVPLPLSFINNRHCNAKFTRVSMLENLLPYMKNLTEATQFTLLEELNNRKKSKANSQPPYSVAMLRFGLHFRYSSSQAYRLLLDKFPLPSFSLLKTIQRGGVDSIKIIKLLWEKGDVLTKDVRS